MASAKFDIRTEATRAFYAGVGVNDLAVEFVREYVAEVQQRFAGVQQDVQKNVTDPKALREQAVTVVNARVDALAKDAKARRAAIEARVADLQGEARSYPAKVQALVSENVATANDAYGDLVKRGESLVGRIRRQESTKAATASAKTTAAKAKTTRTQGTKATKTTAKKASTTARKQSASTRSSAKATGTAARKTAANATQATADAAQKVGD